MDLFLVNHFLHLEENYLTEDTSRLVVGLLHKTENGEIPVVELFCQRLQALHHQRLPVQDWFVLQG